MGLPTCTGVCTFIATRVRDCHLINFILRTTSSAKVRCWLFKVIIRCALVIIMLPLCGLALMIGSAAGSASTEKVSTVDVWRLKSGEINSENYFGETVANGVLGIRSSTVPFRGSLTVLGGTYDILGSDNVDTLLPVFNLLDLDVSIDNVPIKNSRQVRHYSQTLDMKHAGLATMFDYGDKASVRYTWYSLRQSPYTALAEISVTAHAPLTLGVVSSLGSVQPLTESSRNTQSFQDVNTPPIPLELLTAVAHSPFRNFLISATTAFRFETWTNVPLVTARKARDGSDAIGFDTQMPAGGSLRFFLVGSCISEIQNGDPRIETGRLTVSAALKGGDELIAEHERQWRDLWASDIRIDGDDQTQRDVHAMIYHLYSFAREGTANSIPPMGLSSSQNYFGHIFWDADTWMFPVLLALQPHTARSLIMYRVDRLPAARRNAVANGYAGAMFPWESALSGDEHTPLCCLTGGFEHHVTADIALAAWQYYQVTQDIDWLRESGWPLLRDTATFWASRVTRSGPRHYSIRAVVGADEFSGVVDNDAFTNAAAKANLAAAIAAAKVLGKTPDPDWQHIHDNIPILRFADGIVREYEGYDGKPIKQADVNLLAYPLHETTNPHSIHRDLDFYSSRVREGPAMTHSIFSILYVRTGNPEKAFDEFTTGYLLNQRPPFGVLSEYATNNGVYFTTGAAGLLQAMIYGFGGLEITPSGFIQKPTCLPAVWNKLTLTGIGPQHRTYSVGTRTRALEKYRTP
jgi:protein-glucosylgalactosylhydroxylysine glucosidase